MSIMDVPKEHRRTHVATLLGYNPADPKTWPDMIVDTVIAHVDEAADRKLHEMIRKLTYSGRS